MGYVSEELKSTAKELRIPLLILSVSAAQEVRARLANKYGVDPGYLFHYAKVPNIASICDASAWKWLQDLVGDSACMLLFPVDIDEAVFQIANGSDLVRILGASVGFVFYITDEELNFLVCFDDHDCLLGLGRAAEWIRQRSSKSQERG